MKKELLYSLIFSLFISYHISAQQASFSWARGIGGSSSDIANDVATDKNGHVYVIGEFASTNIQFGSTILTNSNNVNRDFFIAKYDSFGNVLWAKSVGGLQDEQGFAISVDSFGNVCVFGRFYSPSISFDNITLFNADNTGGTNDIFLAKYDPNGNVLWARRVGGTNNDLVSGNLTIDNNGSILITASYLSTSVTVGNTTLNNAGSGDILLAKFDVLGNPVWAKKAGGNDLDSGTSISTDIYGNVYLAGNFRSSSIIFGTTILNNSSINNTDLFIAKYSSTGNEIWAKKAGGLLGETITSISNDTKGNCYVTGTFGSTSISFGNVTLSNSSGFGNYFIAKFDTLGNAVWASSSGLSCAGTGIVTDKNNYIYTTGFFSDSLSLGSYKLNSLGSDDIFIAKYDTNGIVLWANRSGGINYETTRSISVNNDGDLYIVGNFLTSSIFGSHSITSNGSNDVLIAKISECLQIPPSISPSGSVNFCTGDSVRLISSASDSYVWSTGATTQTITVYSSGNFFVTTIDANGCSAMSSIKNVISISPPTVTITPVGNIAFCDGNSVVLNANSGTPNLAFLWSNNETTQSISVYGTGVYSVTVTDNNSCSGKSAPKYVTSYPLPEIPTITANGAVLSSSSPNNNQWYINDTAITNATSQSYLVTQDGYYSVKVTDSNGCSSISESYYHVVTSNNYEYNVDIDIFPNPNNGIFRLKSNKSNLFKVKVFNLLGQQIKHLETDSAEVNLRILPKGTYTIEIMNENNERTYRKVIIN